MLIKYRGTPPKIPELQVPGWAGDEQGQFQPWHSKMFADAATSGLELIYTDEDVVIPQVRSPFTQVSKHYYLLETETILKSPEKCSAFITPHYRFYTDHSWQTPIPVASMIDTDWWPNQLQILFRTPPPGCKTVFRKGEPFAQINFITRGGVTLSPMTEGDITINDEGQTYSRNAQGLVTREWLTADGTRQNNLYEILSYLERSGKAFKSNKKYRIVRDNHV